MVPIFLVVGAPAVGKSTTARALAGKFAKSIHIPVDDVRNMVVSGVAQPGEVWSSDLVEQLSLARTSVTHMALAYNQAGFTVVIDDFWDPNSELSEYQSLFNHAQTCKVLLFPSQTAAHDRNLKRSGASVSRDYLDDGIRLVYQHLNARIAELERQGWQVLDTTNLSLDLAVSRILEWAKHKEPF